ncbi:MAG TPA: hypothetical protein VL336_06975 [Sphingomicrobium sp.]|jgi:hypothetical protein|nr:hypothetical protein [Sphingomicrobium sp.]
MALSWSVLATLALAGIGTSALLQPAPSDKQRDAHEIVCEKTKLPGSRVEARRVCGTRAEWAELRRREREMANQAPRSANTGCQAVAMYPMSPGC